MNRYHFHLRFADQVEYDRDGKFLPDLSAVVAEAEAIARGMIERNPAILTELHKWRLDVRGADDVMLFTYPFTEVPLDRNPDQLRNAS